MKRVQRSHRRRKRLQGARQDQRDELDQRNASQAAAFTGELVDSVSPADPAALDGGAADGRVPRSGYYGPRATPGRYGWLRRRPLVFHQGPASCPDRRSGHRARFARIAAAWVAAGVALGGCGEGDLAPLAQPQTLTMLEDQVLDGAVSASDILHRKVTYAVAVAPVHGALDLDPETGRFRYWPDPDFNGQGAFLFTASNGTATSEPATVSIVVEPVNDAPRIDPIPDQANSAETLETFVAVRATDVDGDPLQYSAAVADPAVAASTVDATGTLVLTPLARGATAVTVAVSDGTLKATAAFAFTVADALKLRRWTVDQPRAHAVSIYNTSDREVSFELRHNGARLLPSLAEVANDVDAMPEERPFEAFERRLWRYLRDNVYHYVPITAAAWLHDPVLLVNSVGFGFCDDVAAAYVVLAQSWGYEARIWDLYGHVVPEIRTQGKWHVYDPDLAVYYEDSASEVVGLSELSADASLIVQPRNPLRSDFASWTGYSAEVADIYATVLDNYVYSRPAYTPSAPVAGLRLPPGAKVTYPGSWAAPPRVLYGSPPVVYAQARVDLPVGFTGHFELPLLLWDVQGAGRIQVGGVEYVAGSPELTTAIQSLGSPYTGAEIVEATGTISLVYLVNPMRFSMAGVTDVEVSALDAWALSVALVALQDPLTYSSPDVVAKPR